jgi:hypothetical protein
MEATTTTPVQTEETPTINDPAKSDSQSLMRLERVAAPATITHEPLPWIYRGASELGIDSTAAGILTAPVDEKDLEILPTGEVYASQVRYRKTLNAAVGVGNWALVPLCKPVLKDENICQEWALYIHGKFAGRAWGENGYTGQNDRQSEFTALEGAKSDALKRCCKDLGIASECWDRRYTEDWKRKHAVAVYTERKKRDGAIWKEVAYRRKDDRPLIGEQGILAWELVDKYGKLAFMHTGAPKAKPAPAAAPAKDEDVSQEGSTDAEPVEAARVEKFAVQAFERYGVKPVKARKEGAPDDHRHYARGLRDKGWYYTFSEAIGAQLRDAAASKKEFEVSYVVTEFGNEVKSLAEVKA